MTTVFRRCLLVNYAVAADVLAAMLPAPLEPDLAAGRGWLSVVIADMQQMRPAGIPAVLGLSYRQIVYRAVVRYRSSRGVYFLRSDADNRFMNAGGNLLSFFRFHHATVVWAGDGGQQQIAVRTRDGSADIDLILGADDGAGLPGDSSFAGLSEARQHLVELFTAYHPRSNENRLDVVRISRANWNLTVAPVRSARCGFLDGQGPFPLGSARLDSVFAAHDVPYYWHRLRTQKITG
jgi:hypothetical protein